jgi:hypothetical protein
MIVAETQRTFRGLVDCLTGKPRAPRDWRSLVALASETLTIGSLAEALLAGDDRVDVPDEVRELLGDVRDRARKRNRLAIGQFRELLAPLNGIGVRPIAMKGLARLLSSPDEQSRLLSDIDLLVPVEQRNACVLALAGIGYRIVEGAQDDRPPVLARALDAGTVDLHTRLKPPWLKLAYHDIAPHCRQLELPEGVALLPSATCQLALEILHDQLHDRDYWRGLVDVRHLIDVHHLVREGVDWPLLASFFEAGIPRRALKVQMLTARGLLKIDAPEQYCDGAWTRLQLLRRRLQARLPVMRALFTLLTIVADPPPASVPDSAPGRRNGTLWKLGDVLDRYFWRTYPGKL